jgi:hypothetical protein
LTLNPPAGIGVACRGHFRSGAAKILLLPENSDDLCFSHPVKIIRNFPYFLPEILTTFFSQNLLLKFALFLPENPDDLFFSHPVKICRKPQFLHTFIAGKTDLPEI